MTIPSTPRSAGPFAGNGVATAFPFAFRVFAADDIAVTLTAPDGAQTGLVLDSDYSVTLNPDQNASPGGSIVYPISGAPLQTGWTLAVVGALPYDQPYSPAPGGRFAPTSVENAFDRAVIQIQQLAEIAGRAVRAPVGEPSVELPAAAARAGRLLGFNSVTGAPEAVVPEPGTAGALYADLASADPGKGADLVRYVGGRAGTAGSIAEKLNERVSVRDFGATGDGVTDDTAALQAALDYVNGLGGGAVHVPAPGVYAVGGAVSLRANVHLLVDDSATVDCSSNTASTAFSAPGGGVGTEVAIAANVTSGGLVITTVSPHGLAAGDWLLLKSQRACLHADAGRWRLGETTSGTASPFFAEPLQVATVDSPTQVTVSSPIIFPDYRTDATAETYPSARPSATVAKITFVEGVRVSGGTWVKPGADGFNLLRLNWCYRPAVSIPDIQLGIWSGSGVYVNNCLLGRFDIGVSRPAGWGLRGIDHSAFNACKDVGAWYSDWRIEELNGCQGWDQSFLSAQHPCIAPKLRMRAVNPLETGSTTHGACYGADVEVEAFSPKTCGFFNRAPFTRIKLRVHGEGAGGSGGLILGGWGAVDTLVHDSHIDNVPYGIDVNPVGSVDTAPPETNLVISNLVATNVASGAAVWLRDRATEDPTPSGVTIRGVTVRDVQRGILVGAGWHGVSIDGANITRMDTASPRYGVDVSSGAGACTIRNVTGVDIGAGNYLVRPNAPSAAVESAFGVTAVLDEPSIVLFGATGTRLSLPASKRVGYIAASGTYSPELTASENSTPTTPGEGMYSVVGRVVTVSLRVTITAPATGRCRTLVSLPLPGTNLSSVGQAAGVGQSLSSVTPRTIAVYADSTNDALVLEWYSGGTGESRTFSVTAQYLAG